MNSFNFFVPTQIRFGRGRRKELKDILPLYGKKCLMVSRPLNGSLKETFEEIISIIRSANIEVSFFDEVIPNPTLEGVEKGVALAVAHQVDFVIGIGGGSVLDTAKLIAFLFNENININWEEAKSKYDNPFAMSPKPEASLPFIAVSTTSGTGSQCTQAAVVSDTKNKVTFFHSALFPAVAIVDPELMLSVPISVTAATGFDAFTHAFESFLGNRVSPITEQMSLQAIKLVVQNLPKAIKDPNNIKVRSNLAWADTLAGMCLANGGADLPHPLGEIIGGICSRIAHGDTLAIVYPAFLKHKEKIAPKKFIKVAEYLGLESDPSSLRNCLIDLFKVTGLNTVLEKAKISKEESNDIMRHPLLINLQPNNSKTIVQLMKDSLYK
jgi:alcohol dehydrogenase class IV